MATMRSNSEALQEEICSLPEFNVLTEEASSEVK
jgi:hypothetical protein